MPERRLAPELSQWVVQSLSRLLATYAILQGLFIVIGGAARWSGKSLATALAFPGAPASWGLILFALGVIALACTFRPRMRAVAASLFAIAVWDLFFAVSLLITLLQEPTAPTTGFFVYGHQAVLACVLAVTYVRSRP